MVSGDGFLFPRSKRDISALSRRIHASVEPLLKIFLSFFLTDIPVRLNRYTVSHLTYLPELDGQPKYQQAGSVMGGRYHLYPAADRLGVRLPIVRRLVCRRLENCVGAAIG